MASIAVQLALFVALIFVIVSSQPAYKATTFLASPLKLRLADSAGNATRTGLVTHALVVFGIVYAYARLNAV